MTPTTFQPWYAAQKPQSCVTDTDTTDPETEARRRKAYLDGISFIRSQIGALPLTPFPSGPRSNP
jgi:hypothetical protein